MATSTADAVNQRIKALVEDVPIVIFSKSFCPYCREVKALFAELKADPFVVELDLTNDGPLAQAALLEITGQRTVPNVWVNGKHIGGNDATQALAAMGELQKMLGLAPAPALVRSKSGRDVTPGLAAADEIKVMVKDLILACPAVVFSKSYCPFCRKVKALFASLEQPICTIELDQTSDGADIQATLLEVTRQRTVPSVFIHGRHIGGNDDAQGLAASGELQKMLAAGPQ